MFLGDYPMMAAKCLISKVVRLNCSLCGLKHASRSWHNHLLTHIFLNLPSATLMRVLRLIDLGSVSIVTVVHVDDIFAAGLKARCDQFCENLQRLVPINNLGEFRWYAGRRFAGDWGAGAFTFSQQAFAEKTAARFDVSSGRSTPLSTGLKLEVFDKNEPVGDCSFRELVGCLM